MSRLSEQYFLPFFTLTKKEVLRFLAVPLQTLAAPVVSASLFLFIFGVNLGGRISSFGDFSYAQFVVPGLILMGVVNNSFLNSASSLFFSRYIGNIVDLLVTPLGPLGLIFAYTFPAMLRGLLVGIAVQIISMAFTDLPWVNPLQAVLMIVLTSFLFAQFGLIAALYSNTFDVLSMYSNFLLLPLVYLGGVFYPISILPPIWQKVSHFNPLFYLIDGFRSSILGQGDIPFGWSLAVVLGISLVIFTWLVVLVSRGSRLRN